MNPAKLAENLLLVKQDGRNLRGMYYTNKEIHLEACKQNGFAICFSNKSGKPDVCLAASAEAPTKWHGTKIL